MDEKEKNDHASDRRKFIELSALGAASLLVPSEGMAQSNKNEPQEAIKPQKAPEKKVDPSKKMELGNFSISLAVKDIEASRSFYEKFGFKVFMGNAAQKWLIMKNGDHAIGLFQGMFEKNIMTFNPGWDSNGQKLTSFTDVRDLQRQLKAQGVQFQAQADESTTGPASFIAVDPDGNPILVDQHV